jgi:tetratricopeptide (TPR) repeat protein
MRKSQRIAQEDSFKSARIYEREGCLDDAVKGYEKLLKKNPEHTEAISRLLILYRKKKSRQKELQLLESAIAGLQSRIQSDQREWVSEHKQLADLSRPLAKMLGLLDENDLPTYPDELLSRWKTRLEALKKKIALEKRPQKPRKKAKIFKVKRTNKD